MKQTAVDVNDMEAMLGKIKHLTVIDNTDKERQRVFTVANANPNGMSLGDVIYPTPTWLSETAAATGEIKFNNNTGYHNSIYDYRPYTWPATYVQYQDRKIRLKLSEVETLRELAKGNDVARTVLNKLAPFIEIEVDF